MRKILFGFENSLARMTEKCTFNKSPRQSRSRPSAQKNGFNLLEEDTCRLVSLFVVNLHEEI